MRAPTIGARATDPPPPLRAAAPAAPPNVNGLQGEEADERPGKPNRRCPGPPRALARDRAAASLPSRSSPAQSAPAAENVGSLRRTRERPTKSTVEVVNVGRLRRRAYELTKSL